MRIRFLGLAVALAALVLTTSRPAAAQGLASVAAASAVVGASATAEQATNCFVCGSFIGIQYCQSGNESGRKDCNMSLMNLCGISSESCGAKAALPVDPDGAAQYVSRGSLLGVLASADSPPTKVNCEGVVIARNQTPDDIVAVRSRTGTLSL